MTPKQMALSRLARLALNAESESPPARRAETCRLVALALSDDCPDLASLAAATAAKYSEAHETESQLKELLES